MRYAIVTFGCRVNQADSQRIEEALRRAGGEPVSADRADLVFVNTCTVTATSDQGARQTIRRIARENPAARIVATGCYATRAAHEVRTLPGVVAVISNEKKDELAADPLRQIGQTTAERFGDGDGPCGQRVDGDVVVEPARCELVEPVSGQLAEPGRAGRTALTLRVQTGCDETCSYCIIPSTRGVGRSAPRAAVVADVARAAAAGFKEIALTGVHLGSYGRDLSPKSSLLELLDALDHGPHHVLFRISSLEPMDCTPAIVDRVARSGRFAPHFHLPLQHASDDVLRRMRRPYTLTDYRRTIDNIRDQLPHASIGSDLIVGFPGETDEDAELTLQYLSASPLTYLHVFPYSDRPGTDAARLGAGARVPGMIVRQRARALRDVGAELTRRCHLSQIGSVRPALTIEDGSVALTDNYLRVSIAAGLRRNQRISVRITEAAESIRGEVYGSNPGGA